jgi:hypothetical protein
MNLRKFVLSISILLLLGLFQFGKAQVSPTLRYVRGTLSPTKVGKGKAVAFSLQVNNPRNVGMDLDINSYITFNDGVETYLAYLSAPITVSPKETVTLSFESAIVADNFSSGSFFPSLFLSDGGVNDQTRLVSDPVEIFTPPLIIDIERSDIKIVWQTDPGVTYDVYFQDSFGGIWTDVSDVYADGTTAFWVDDGSETGSSPSTVNERYYRIAVQGTSIYSPGTVGKFCRDILPGWNLVSLPLVPFQNGIANVIGWQLTGAMDSDSADAVYKWDAETQTYNEFAWLVDTEGQYPEWDGKWVDENFNESTMTLDVGEGFWIRNRHGIQTVDIVGKVSDGSTFDISISLGMNLVGSPYPIKSVSHFSGSGR